MSPTLGYVRRQCEWDLGRKPGRYCIVTLGFTPKYCSLLWSEYKSLLWIFLKASNTLLKQRCAWVERWWGGTLSPSCYLQCNLDDPPLLGSHLAGQEVGGGGKLHPAIHRFQPISITKHLCCQGGETSTSRPPLFAPQWWLNTWKPHPLFLRRRR